MFGLTAITLAYTLLGLSNLATPVSAAPIASDSQAHTLAKRQSFNGRATFYDVGLGACGQYNVESDYIVALNTAQYGSGYPGPNCGRSITISYGGKTAQATIMDQCPSCGFGDLDLSRSLFNHFSDPGAGVFQMSWSFNDGNGGGQQQQQQPKTSSKPKPTPTSTWTPPTSTWTPEPTPTSTWTPPSSTSTYTPTPTSSSFDATSVSNSTNASASSDSSAIIVPLNATVSGSTISIPLPTYALPAGMGNLALLNQFVTNLGAVIVIGAEAEAEMNGTVSMESNSTVVVNATSTSLA